jgi:hypothetical protein
LFLVNVKQLNIFSSNSMLNTNESSLVSFRKVVSIFKITKISGQKWTAFLIKVNTYWCGLFLRTVFAIWSRALFFYIGCDYAVLYELFLLCYFTDQQLFLWNDLISLSFSLWQSCHVNIHQLVMSLLQMFSCPLICSENIKMFIQVILQIKMSFSNAYEPIQ